MRRLHLETSIHRRYSNRKSQCHPASSNAASGQQAEVLEWAVELELVGEQEKVQSAEGQLELVEVLPVAQLGLQN
jgi:hypothetical protein